ncbi:hypothetical protein B0H13DRAFT_927329 [Mycena leptocephala]|nr:hypothetical protein B0H13DRAFT_927329 [Mycena leptocephala]
MEFADLRAHCVPPQVAKDTQVLERTLSIITEISKIRSSAQVIRDTRIWDYIPELLRSSLEIYQSTCDILRNLAFRETASLATVKVNDIGVRKHGMHHEAQRNAIRTFSKLSYWPEGFPAVVVLKVLEYASELLASPDSGTRGGTCEMLGNMAFNKLTTVGEMVVGHSIQIVPLLRDTDIQVQRQALYALSKRATGPMSHRP